MSKPTVSHVINEYSAFAELLDDAYWEASSIAAKDFLYDIINNFSQEMSELNKLSIQDHHYPYELITEGIRRVIPKIYELDERKAELITRTKTYIDMREVISNIIAIIESQSD